MSQPLVLLLGKDESLADSRRLILEGMGYAVLCVQHNEEAKRIFLTERIDILILCHTVPDLERSDILRTARASNAEVRCLWLLGFCGGDVPDGTTGYCPLEGPSLFVQHIRSLSA